MIIRPEQLFLFCVFICISIGITMFSTWYFQREYNNQIKLIIKWFDEQHKINAEFIKLHKENSNERKSK